MEFSHVSVLLEETMEYLAIKPDGIYVDGTLGGGGHSLEVVKRLSKKGRLIGMDQDGDAIKAAEMRLKDYKTQIMVLRNNYCNMKQALKEAGIQKADGILLDLGVSSFQLDTKERGFSYMEPDALLDMRMDTRSRLCAEDVVNEYSEGELYRIIQRYGEDRFAKNIAKHIVEEREKKRIQTAGELTEIIRASIPKKIQVTGGHPAKRTFQALRIEVNHELDVLEQSLDDMIELLNPLGRLCIITFHSLEDRIVKKNFRRNESPCTCPREFPVCVCGKVSRGRVITRKPVLPGEKECQKNPRAKSAKLRVFEKAGDSR